MRRSGACKQSGLLNENNYVPGLSKAPSHLVWDQEAQGVAPRNALSAEAPAVVAVGEPFDEGAVEGVDLEVGEASALQYG